MWGRRFRLPAGERSSTFTAVLNCISRSCFSAASRVENVPGFLRFPLFASVFEEYNRYSPDLSFLIIPVPMQFACHSARHERDVFDIRAMRNIEHAGDGGEFQIARGLHEQNTVAAA